MIPLIYKDSAITPRLSKHQAAKRNSGGLGIFVRNSIKEGVEILNGNNDVMAWLR